MLKEQNVGAARLIDALKVENAYLQTVLPPQSDYKLKLSYEKLQKEFQELRAQNAEALTSLKILEDENEELTQDLDRLRNQTKKAAAPNVE